MKNIFLRVLNENVFFFYDVCLKICESVLLFMILNIFAFYVKCVQYCVFFYINIVYVIQENQINIFLWLIFRIWYLFVDILFTKQI